MDEKDSLLIEHLRKNSKQSVQELAKATKIPSTTVHNRIKRLEKDGIIKQYTIKTDAKKSNQIQAFFEVSVNSADIPEFLKKIKCDEIYSVAGDYQFLIKCSFHDLGGVYSFTAQLQQAKAEKIKTSVVLEEL